MQEILIPILILAGLGLLAGLLLAIASAVMSVKTDETVAALTEALPGVNCGACGYSGCSAYAAALAKGGKDGSVKTNLCAPGGDPVSKKVSEILGTGYSDVEEQVAVVCCNGNCTVTDKKYDYHGTPSCAACNTLFAGNGACAYGCLGFGDCVNACPYGAISIRDGIAVIDRNICTGCGICVSKCPKHLILRHRLTGTVDVVCANHQDGKTARAICKNGCIACGKCERTCQYDAIHVVDKLARIDYEKCVSCGACVEACPVKCIHMAQPTLGGTVAVQDESC